MSVKPKIVYGRTTKDKSGAPAPAQKPPRNTTMGGTQQK